MNHIFLTRGCYCAAALSQHRRAPASAGASPSYWHNMAQGVGAVTVNGLGVGTRGRKLDSGYERKPPDKFDHFSLWVFFASHKQPPAECCWISLTYVVVMWCKLSISFRSCFCFASLDHFAQKALFMLVFRCSQYFINVYSFLFFHFFHVPVMPLLLCTLKWLLLISGM